MSTATVTRPRSDERKQFLTDLLITAVENYGYGWFAVEEYRHEVPLGEAYAVIVEHDGDEVNTYRIDIDTMAKGIGVIRDAVMRELTGKYDDKGEVPHNAKTGERMYLSPAQRKNILLASRTNGDDGDIDVVDALAVLECALFGRVAYA